MTALTLYPHEIRRLFSAGSVLVLRPVKPQQPANIIKAELWADGLWRIEHEPVPAPGGGHYVTVRTRCPLGAPGSVAWVRETWAPLEHSFAVIARDDPMPQRDLSRFLPIVYKADLAVWTEYGRRHGKSYQTFGSSVSWRSPVTMPRWASRCDVTVQDIRVLRMETLNDDDAVHAGWSDKLALGVGWAACYAYRERAHQAYDIPAWAWVVTVQRNPFVA